MNLTTLRPRSRVTPADHGASYHRVTGVRQHDGRVWLGSLDEAAIAVVDR